MSYHIQGPNDSIRGGGSGDAAKIWDVSKLREPSDHLGKPLEVRLVRTGWPAEPRKCNCDGVNFLGAPG